MLNSEPLSYRPSPQADRTNDQLYHIIETSNPLYYVPVGYLGKSVGCVSCAFKSRASMAVAREP